MPDKNACFLILNWVLSKHALFIESSLQAIFSDMTARGGKEMDDFTFSNKKDTYPFCAEERLSYSKSEHHSKDGSGMPNYRSLLITFQLASYHYTFQCIIASDNAGSSTHWLIWSHSCWKMLVALAHTVTTLYLAWVGMWNRPLVVSFVLCDQKFLFSDCNLRIAYAWLSVEWLPHLCALIIVLISVLKMERSFVYPEIAVMWHSCLALEKPDYYVAYF